MNPNDIFWLARYAHNQTAPLFAQAKAIEPSIHTSIQISFASEEVPGGRESSINVYAHWGRDGMFLYAACLKDKAAVDGLLGSLEEKVAALRPLETVIAA